MTRIVLHSRPLCGGRIVVHAFPAARRGGGETLRDNPDDMEEFIAWLRQGAGDRFNNLDMRHIVKEYEDHTLDEAKRDAMTDEEIAPIILGRTEEDETVVRGMADQFKEMMSTAEMTGIERRSISNSIRMAQRELNYDVDRPTSEGLKGYQNRENGYTVKGVHHPGYIEVIAELRARVDELLGQVRTQGGGLERVRTLEAEVVKLTEEVRTLRREREEAIRAVTVATNVGDDARQPTQQDVDKLYGEFSVAFRNRAGREPLPNEYSEFVRCVENAQTVGQAKSECTRLVELHARPSRAAPARPPPPSALPEPERSWATLDQLEDPIRLPTETGDERRRNRAMARNLAREVRRRRPRKRGPVVPEGLRATGRRVYILTNHKTGKTTWMPFDKASLIPEFLRWVRKSEGKYTTRRIL